MKLNDQTPSFPSKKFIALLFSIEKSIVYTLVYYSGAKSYNINNKYYCIYSNLLTEANNVLVKLDTLLLYSTSKIFAGVNLLIYIKSYGVL